MAGPFAYQPQTSPRSMPLPSGRGAGFGEDVARGMETLGGAISSAADQQAHTRLQVNAIEKERRQATEYSQAAVDWAKQQGELRAKVFDLRNDPDADPRTLGDRARALLDPAISDRLNQITDPEVRQRLAPQLAEWSAAQIAEAHVAGAGDAAELQVTNHGQWRNLTADNLQNDPAAFATALAAGAGLRSSYRLPKTVQAKLEAEDNAVLAHSAALGRINANPQNGLDLIDGGHFAGYLTPGDEATLRSHAEALLHQQAVEAKAQQSVLVQQQKEEEATYAARAAKGVAVDYDEGTRLAARAEARGDTSTAVNLRASATASRAASAYDKALPSQITDRIATIEATPHWQQNDALAVEHSALVEKRNQRRNDEPNIALPNLNDPAGVGRYEAAVEADAKTRGVPPTYVFGDLKRLLDGYMTQGDQGQKQALDTLGHFSTRAAFTAARQIAPHDGVFQMAATLHGYSRELALKGRGALSMDEGKAKDQRVVSADDMNQQLDAIRAAMGAGDPDFVKAAQETALAITAELHRRQGKTKFDRGLAAEGARLALGGGMRGAQKTGGLGEVDGHPVILPDDMSQDEFDRRYYRLSGPSKAYGSGRPLTFEQLRRYRLVSSGDGEYQWQSAFGQTVTDDKGHPVTLHIRRFDPPHVKPHFAAPSSAYQLEGM